MENWLERTILLMGEEKLERLKKAHVLVVGVGGVGAYAAEMICRAGVGKMTIIDGDVVNASNINRQLVARHSTIGEKKVDILSKRLLDINPNLELVAKYEFIHDELTEELLDSDTFDFIVDAIDTLSPKVNLIASAMRRKIKIVSSMGAGARIDPTRIQFADISATRECTLAKAVRKRLAKIGIRKGLPTVFSTEAPNRSAVLLTETERNKKSTVGTISYMPAIFGCFLASHVIRKL
ncbi:MAG: tRNA threonylcarbamoyladenosine dehydratase [Bacteroidales bacterium]